MGYNGQVSFQSLFLDSKKRLKIRRLVLTRLGGGGEIRTHGPVSEATVFKTVPLDRSGTPPQYNQ